MIPSRRRFLFGAGALLAAPAIVRVASLMPVSTFYGGPVGGEMTAYEVSLRVAEYIRNALPLFDPEMAALDALKGAVPAEWLQLEGAASVTQYGGMLRA